MVIVQNGYRWLPCGDDDIFSINCAALLSERTLIEKDNTNHFAGAWSANCHVAICLGAYLECNPCAQICPRDQCITGWTGVATEARGWNGHASFALVLATFGYVDCSTLSKINTTITSSHLRPSVVWICRQQHPALNKHCNYIMLYKAKSYLDICQWQHPVKDKHYNYIMLFETKSIKHYPARMNRWHECYITFTPVIYRQCKNE